jgi:hypothetical protein
LVLSKLNRTHTHKKYEYVYNKVKKKKDMEFLHGVSIATFIASKACRVPMIPGTNARK